MKPHLLKTLWISAVVIAALVGTIRFMKKNDYAHYGREYTWHVEANEQDGSERLVRGGRIDEIRRDGTKLVFALNRTFLESERGGGRGGDGEPARMKFQGAEKGIARVEIANSEYLSERLGSSGSQGYLAAATFTLTELPGVTAVEFLFPAGEHAMPGVYSRESFSGFGSKPEPVDAASGGATTTEENREQPGEPDGKDRF